MKKTTWLKVLAFALPLAGCELLEEWRPGGGGPGGPAPGGGTGPACTAIGCHDGAYLTVRAMNGLAAGPHTVEIQAGSDPLRTCTFDVPAGGPGPGGVSASCTPGVMLYISPRVTCTEMTSGAATSQTCVPVPGQFEEHINVQGTPAFVRVIQRAGTETVLERTEMLTYKAATPNGPMCGPVCNQAHVTWEIANRPL